MLHYSPLVFVYLNMVYSHFDICFKLSWCTTSLRTLGFQCERGSHLKLCSLCLPYSGYTILFFFPFISDISIYIPVLAPISGFSLDYWFDILTCAWGEKHFLWYFGGQELWKSISKVIFSVFRDDLEKSLYLPFWSFTYYSWVYQFRLSVLFNDKFDPLGNVNSSFVVAEMLGGELPNNDFKNDDSQIVDVMLGGKTCWFWTLYSNMAWDAWVALTNG